MKKIVYIACLLLAFQFGSSLVSTVLSPLIMLIVKIPAGAHIVGIFIRLLVSLINILILYRICIFIKSKSFTIPSNFNKFMFITGLIALAPAVIVGIGYAYILATNKVGVSGIPLAYAGALTGLLSVIPIICCELKDFYENIPDV